MQPCSRAADWPTDSDESSYATAARRGRASGGVLLALLAAPWLAAQFAFLSGAQVAAFGAATWIALSVLLLAVFAVVHFPARRAARAEPAESLHEL